MKCEIIMLAIGLFINPCQVESIALEMGSTPFRCRVWINGHNKGFRNVTRSWEVGETCESVSKKLTNGV